MAQRLKIGYPVGPGFPITAAPGEKGERWKTEHHGYDFGSQRGPQKEIIRPIMGEPIRAVMDGQVSIAGVHRIWDKEREEWVDGPFGLRLWLMCMTPDLKAVRFGYCHLSSLSVAEIQNVKKGDILGAVGNSGNSTAPHLHFQPETWPDRDLIEVEFTEEDIV
jgi:murein DD-endopeptidase MepM/ murein hydrolase activator NlpD